MPQIYDANRPTLTKDDVRRYVDAMLGAPKQRIELVEVHYEEAIKKALNVFNRYIPKRKTGVLQLLEGKNKYPLEHFGKGIISVEVFRDSEISRDPDGKVNDNWLLFGPGRIYWSTGGYYGHLFDNLGYYEWSNMHLNTVRRITSGELSWRFEGGVLYITNHYGGRACYTYVEDHDIAEIPISYIEWVKDYTLAICKSILGNIRSRFSSIPGPGTDIVQNGDSLKADAANEMDKLIEDLKSMSEDLGPHWG